MMTSILFKKIIFLIIFLTCATSASTELYVDIRDKRDYGRESQIYKNLFRALERCEICLPENVRYLAYGANKDLDFTQKNVALSVYEFSPRVNLTLNNTTQFFLMALVLETDSLFVRKSSVVLSGVSIVDAQHEDLPITTGEWTIAINAISRSLVLENSSIGFKSIYPIVVGGFSTNLDKLQLPPEKTYILNSYKTSSGKVVGNLFSRTDPVYYQGYPFIKLLTSGNNYTSFGLHAPMSPGDMKRGFLSTGCIRLRVKDIYEIYHLVNQLKNQYPIPVTTQYLSHVTYDHPYPLYNDSYKVDAGVGKGTDGLTVMTHIYEPAPIEKIINSLR